MLLIVFKPLFFHFFFRDINSINKNQLSSQQQTENWLKSIPDPQKADKCTNNDDIINLLSDDDDDFESAEKEKKKEREKQGEFRENLPLYSVQNDMLSS